MTLCCITACLVNGIQSEQWNSNSVSVTVRFTIRWAVDHQTWGPCSASCSLTVSVNTAVPSGLHWLISLWTNAGHFSIYVAGDQGGMALALDQQQSLQTGCGVRRLYKKCLPLSKLAFFSAGIEHSFPLECFWFRWTGHHYHVIIPILFFWIYSFCDHVSFSLDMDNGQWCIHISCNTQQCKIALQTRSLHFQFQHHKIQNT